MRILWKQKHPSTDGCEGLFWRLSVERCYLKHIRTDMDRERTTRKTHHHTGVEMHVITKGYQVYELTEGCVRVEAGQCLLLPPMLPHRAVEEGTDTVKYSLTFGVERTEELVLYVGETPDGVTECLWRIEREREGTFPLGDSLVGILVWECVLRLLRLMGLRGKETAEMPAKEDRDARYSLAVQYIEDNRSRAVTVSEVADYCGISQKQLGRLFAAEEKGTVAAYIRGVRCREIERLLAETELSLRQISEATDFQNEYYFNAFFKQYAGMTPGAYRKSLRKGT